MSISRPVGYSVGGLVGASLPDAFGYDGGGAVDPLQIYDRTISVADRDGDSVGGVWRSGGTTAEIRGFSITIANAGASFISLPVELGQIVAQALLTYNVKTEVAASGVDVNVPTPPAATVPLSNTFLPTFIALDNVAGNPGTVGPHTVDITSLVNTVANHANWELNDWFNIALQLNTGNGNLLVGAVDSGGVANDPMRLQVFEHPQFGFISGTNGALLRGFMSMANPGGTFGQIWPVTMQGENVWEFTTTSASDLTILKFGTGSTQLLRIAEITFILDGTVFTLVWSAADSDYRANIPGLFTLMNAEQGNSLSLTEAHALPQAQATLLAWDSNNSTEIFSDAGTTEITDTGTVQQWDAEEGSFLVSQSNSALRPVWNRAALNSRGLLAFDGVNDYLQTIGISGVSTDNFSIYALIDVDLFKAGESYLGFSRNGAEAPWQGHLGFSFQVNSGGDGIQFLRNNLQATGTRTVIDSGTLTSGPHQIEVHHRAGAAFMIVDGGDPIAASSVGSGTLNPDTITVGGSQGFNGGAVEAWAKMNEGDFRFYPTELTGQWLLDTREAMLGKFLPANAGKLPATLWLGDSFTTQGGFTGSELTTPTLGFITKTAYPTTLVNGNGFQGDGLTAFGAGNFADGTVPRALQTAKNAGRGVKAVHWNYAQSGASATGLGTATAAITALLTRATDDGIDPGVIVVGIGSVDVAIDSVTAYIPGDVLAALRTMRTANPVRFVVREIMSLENEAAHAGTNTLTKSINAEIATFVNETDNATLVATYDAFGGDTPTASLFKTDDIHPNAAGSALLGDLIGAAL